MSQIKNPTLRKVLNRGYIPITYHTDWGQRVGWVEKVGTKLLHIRMERGL